MTDLWYGTSGPHDAEIVILGEAWGSEEEARRLPFVGQSGQLLRGLLAEAKIDPAACLMTNVIPLRPSSGNEMWSLFHPVDTAPRESLFRGLHPLPPVVESLKILEAQIIAFPRKLVLPVGRYATWATTDHMGYDVEDHSQGRRVPTGIMSWRGSMTYHRKLDGTPTTTQLLPIIHPAAIMRQWSLRAVTSHDLKSRIPLALASDWRRRPEPVVWAPPTFDQAVMKLESWLRLAEGGTKIRLAEDIETIRKFNLMTCVGFADSLHFAMTIPWIRRTAAKGVYDSYWSTEQEARLVRLIQRINSHPNILIEGQNFIYDTQYEEYWWGVRTRVDFDTMLAHHLLWPGTPKGLDYLSSLYCQYHWYWKEDGKEWDEKGTLEDLLQYNALDCLRTWECAETLRALISHLGMDALWTRQMRKHELALRMMRRGVRIDKAARDELSRKLLVVADTINARLHAIIPQEWIETTSKRPWFASNKQQKFVFHDMLGMKVIKNRKTGNSTLGKDALLELKRRNPIWTNLFDLLEASRRVGVFRSHIIGAALDPDGRMRCSFNPAGTETHRWSSSKNAFGRGTNLQNWTQGDEDD